MQLLRGNRSFRRLWAGQVISELGNWFNFIAGLGLVRAVSGASPEAAAILLVARLAPFALFAPLAGVLADRWSRRTIMLATDVARAVVALGYLLVDGPEDLWLAYTCAIVGTGLASFFEAAKNAAMPNIAGERGLLAGNALLFSSRFLLMSIGTALGGWTAWRFGYSVAFIINSVSFIVSAYAIWLIPESEMRRRVTEVKGTDEAVPESKSRTRFRTDIQEGWKYIAKHPLVLAIISINILWATGGGAISLITDRLGGVVFAEGEGLHADAGVSALYTAAGIGLFIGMLIARRVGAHVELHKVTAGFIGWTLLAHGIIFALVGLMPSLWMACVLILISRALLGVEFAVQETLLMRLVPDNLRGRVSTTDRAVETLFVGISTVAAGWSLNAISPRTLTIISGLLSATPGVMWLMWFAQGKLQIPQFRQTEPEEVDEAEETALVSAS
ncbi:MAG: MFS transporter [Pyrinomonadaceae bacterium]|nr:MFS transporter [Pyrinomonadaceae bacterium]